MKKLTYTQIPSYSRQCDSIFYVNIILMIKFNTSHSIIEREMKSTTHEGDFSRSCSGPYCPAFGLNAEIYIVNLRIQSKCGNMDQKNLEYGHFSRSADSKCEQGT